MPHHSPLLIGGGAVGVVLRHAGGGTPAAIVDMGGAEHRGEFFLIVVDSSPFTEDGLGGHLLAEGSTALVNPHVALVGTGDEVTKPGMAQLMTDGHVAEIVGGGHALRHEADVVGMLHGTLRGGDITDTLPTVRAKATFEHGYHLLKHVEGGSHAGAVVGGETQNGRIGAIDAFVLALNHVPVG